MPRKPYSSPLRNLLHFLASLWVAISAVQGQSIWRSTLYPADWLPPGQSVSFATAKLIQDFSWAGYRRGEVLLPTITGPVFDVTQYGADPTGTSDSTLAIQSTISGLLRNVGIESLSIGNLQHPGSGWGENDYSDSTNAAFDTHASWLIRFGNVCDSWISGVNSHRASANNSTCHMLSNGVLLASCLRITVRNCQMRRPQYGGGGGNGYMYRLQNSNECIIRNCIADFSRHGFVISHGGTSANVFLQCEDRETKRATGSSSSGYTTSAVPFCSLLGWHGTFRW